MRLNCNKCGKKMVFDKVYECDRLKIHKHLEGFSVCVRDNVEGWNLKNFAEGTMFYLSGRPILMCNDCTVEITGRQPSFLLFASYMPELLEGVSLSLINTAKEEE